MSQAYKDGWDRIFGKSSFPVRTEIEVLPADKPRTTKIGWTVSEIIGISVINPRGMRGRNPADYVRLLEKMSTEEEVRLFILKESEAFPDLMPKLYDVILKNFPQYHKLLRLFSFA